MRRDEKPYINIGASKEGIAELHAAIKTILMSGAEQKTLRAALKALTTGASISGITLTNMVVGPRNDKP